MKIEVNADWWKTLFDEVYLMEGKGTRHNMYFKEHDYFNAKSRVFSAKKVTDFTMDKIAEAYLAGDTLEEVKTNKPTPKLVRKKITPKGGE